ncbi:hypothetical protein [Nonomuraea sp. CA-141351]
MADRHARSTRLLRRMLERLASAPAGRAVSRLLSMLGVWCVEGMVKEVLG